MRQREIGPDAPPHHYPIMVPKIVAPFRSIILQDYVQRELKLARSGPVFIRVHVERVPIEKNPAKSLDVDIQHLQARSAEDHIAGLEPRT